MLKIGVIGFGNRIGCLVNNDLLELAPDAEIVAVTEEKEEYIESAKREMHHPRLNTDSVRFYGSAANMLDKEELDGCMVGTRCSGHARYAAEVLSRDIPLFLEKPVATTIEDLRLLSDRERKTSAQTVVSFPLRFSALIKKVREIVDSGVLGEIEHVQAYNNVPYGGVYYHNWYRDENETGGLFLQKMTHDIDYINYILKKNPVELCAMESKRIFKGNKPAGLKCENCSEYRTCPEGPFQTRIIRGESPGGDFCCFAEDTGNHDSASVLFRYDTGMHVSYSQNFFVRKNAQLRGARFMGYDGTVQFDWYTGKIQVFSHKSSINAEYTVESKGLHFGGDAALIYNFIEVMRGENQSLSPLRDGINSANVCLLAKKSAQERCFMTVGGE